MKKIITLSAALILLVCSCARKNAEASSSMENRIEITPFKITSVILKDTTQIKTAYAQSDSGRITMSEYSSYYAASFIDQKEFNIFKNAIWSLIKNPGSKVFLSDRDFNKPATHEQVREKFVLCDSIAQSSFNAKGEEVITAMYACDSTSRMRNINKINFYESWYFNPKNNMIEREVLGYSVLSYNADKEVYRELFIVFKDEASVIKAKKLYFDLD